MTSISNFKDKTREDFMFSMFLIGKIKSEKKVNILTNSKSLLELNEFENIELEFQETFGDYTNPSSFSINKKSLRFDFIFFEISIFSKSNPDFNDGIIPYWGDNISIEYFFRNYLNLLKSGGQFVLLCNDNRFLSNFPFIYETNYPDPEIGYPTYIEVTDNPYNSFWIENYKYVNSIYEFQNSRNYSSFIISFNKKETSQMAFVSEEFAFLPLDFLVKDKFNEGNFYPHEFFLNPNGSITEPVIAIFQNESTLERYPEGFWMLEYNLTEKFYKSYDLEFFNVKNLKSLGFSFDTIEGFINKSGPYYNLWPIIKDNNEISIDINYELNFISEILSYSNYSKFLFLVSSPNLFTNQYLKKYFSSIKEKIKMSFLVDGTIENSRVESFENFKSILYLEEIKRLSQIDSKKIKLEYLKLNKNQFEKFDFIFIDLDLLQNNNQENFINEILINNLENQSDYNKSLLFIKFKNGSISEKIILNLFSLISDFILLENNSFLVGIRNSAVKKIRVLNCKNQKLQPVIAYKSLKPVKKEKLKISNFNSIFEGINKIKKQKKITRNEIIKSVRQEGKLGREHTTNEIERVIKFFKDEILNLNSQIKYIRFDTTLSQDEKIEKFESEIDKLNTPTELLNEVDFSNKRWYKNWAKLQPNTQTFLKEAFVISKYIEVDFSPVIVQLFRTIENELSKKIFLSFRDKFSKKEIEILFEKNGEKIKNGQWKSQLKIIHQQYLSYVNPKFTYENIENLLSFIPEFDFLLNDSNSTLRQKIYSEINLFKEIQKHIERKFKKLGDEKIFKSFNELKEDRNGGAHDRVIEKNKFEEFMIIFDDVFQKFTNKMY